MTYSFDGTISPELPLDIFLINIVAETRQEKRSVRVSADVRVFAWLIYESWRLAILSKPE